MSIEVRVLRDTADLLAALTLFRSAMIGLPALTEDDAVRLVGMSEPGRSYGAFDGGTLVGTTESYSGTLTVPGGARVAHAAVTHVGVAPGCTRRGVATALLERQLRDAHAAGDVVATLRASSATLYGRFGYAVASSTATVEIDTRHARLAVEWRPEAVRLIDPAQEWDTMRHVYERHPPLRAGTISRPPYWWANVALRERGAPTPHYLATHEGPDGPDGYVRYHAAASDGWFSDRQRTIVVSDFVARTPGASADLLGHLLSRDIAHRIVIASCAIDEPFGWLLDNYRDARVSAVADETWLRILDVRAALAARRYGHYGGEAVIEIADPLIAGNSARFHLSERGVQATSRSPDVVLGIDALSAVYLGGVRWWQLARAGRLDVHHAPALDGLDALFACDAAPFSGTRF
ncbi:GNAT family N-acetyltransferase [Paraburkholderia unamae]|uniref:Acetyltransferase n=1 Tax=Paraburkholderia unamae TaxID=219649 RepID=A0ABX5KN34_9BURK|nr:GNAT family N-acetyltransferase [Paraburkholderia unamae]PVX81695.1 putative acetyltransferase [Paraburkholderia unamae]